MGLGGWHSEQRAMRFLACCRYRVRVGLLLRSARAASPMTSLQCVRGGASGGATFDSAKQVGLVLGSTALVPPSRLEPVGRVCGTVLRSNCAQGHQYVATSAIVVTSFSPSTACWDFSPSGTFEGKPSSTPLVLCSCAKLPKGHVFLHLTAWGCCI